MYGMGCGIKEHSCIDEVTSSLVLLYASMCMHGDKHGVDS